MLTHAWIEIWYMSEALLEPWMICGLEKAQILDSAFGRT